VDSYNIKGITGWEGWFPRFAEGLNHQEGASRPSRPDNAGRLLLLKFSYADKLNQICLSPR
jgi:hypothetical protein